MSNSRVSMHTASSNTAPYVKFDGYVNYKPTKGVFSVYLSESKESKDIKKISGALITQRNVALATSHDDNPVTSQDFDGFDEKLYFRETVKAGKTVAKDLTYSEAKDEAHKLFASNSYRLATAMYLVTEKGAVLKVVLTGTTRSKVNEQLEAFESIDFITLSAGAETVTVGSGSRSQEVYELTVTEETKEYNRVAIDKINGTVNTLKNILEYKKTGKTSEPIEDEWITADDVADTFKDEPKAKAKAVEAEEDDLPI